MALIEAVAVHALGCGAKRPDISIEFIDITSSLAEKKPAPMVGMGAGPIRLCASWAEEKEMPPLRHLPELPFLGPMHFHQLRTRQRLTDGAGIP